MDRPNCVRGRQDIIIGSGMHIEVLTSGAIDYGERVQIIGWFCCKVIRRANMPVMNINTHLEQCEQAKTAIE